jgi:hypothetical protein
MMEQNVPISDKAIDQLHFLCGDDPQKKIALIEELIDEKAEQLYEFLATEEGIMACQHKKLSLVKDNTYKCDICGMGFDIEIPY